MDYYSSLSTAWIQPYQRLHDAFNAVAPETASSLVIVGIAHRKY
jgi:hypothetical protein